MSSLYHISLLVRVAGVLKSFLEATLFLLCVDRPLRTFDRIWLILVDEMAKSGPTTICLVRQGSERMQMIDKLVSIMEKRLL